MSNHLHHIRCAMSRELSRLGKSDTKGNRETLIRTVMMAHGVKDERFLYNQDRRTIWAVILGAGDPASDAHLAGLND